jgi:glycosyltransferase involved in cell wall biosynthesis
MTTPFTTVLIDTYNHERFIEEAVTSALAQDFPTANREILVVDDGSTDRTPEILAKFASQIRILGKPNGGQGSAFNHGIAQCQGEIVAFMDGDDWWAPNRLSRAVQALADDPSLGIVGNGIVNVYQDGRQMTEVLRDGFRFRANTPEGARLLSRRGSFLGTSRMTIRTAILRQIGPIPEDIRIQADEYLFTLSSVLASAEILPDVLTYYRQHDANLFQLAGDDPQKLRRKQESLSALAQGLSHRLQILGVSPDVRRILLGYTQACASQIRLQLDGGWPWQTVSTEWKLYSISHPEANLSHRLFKLSTLFGALFFPPALFYKTKLALTRSHSYKRARRHLLPIPEMQHVRKDKHPPP